MEVRSHRIDGRGEFHLGEMLLEVQGVLKPKNGKRSSNRLYSGDQEDSTMGRRPRSEDHFPKEAKVEP